MVKLPPQTTEDLDAVHYDLAYFGADGQLERVLVDTIARLPEDVRQFALDHCRFLSVGRVSHGMVFRGSIGVDYVTKRSDAVWLVLLFEDVGEDDIHCMVAHEIAHAWLGHSALDPNVPKDAEIVTANLVAEWGFTGLGADADYCDSSARPFREYNERLSNAKE